MNSAVTEFDEVKRKANRAVASASAIIALVVVAGTLFRSWFEGFQTIFPIIWAGCLFALLPLFLVNKLSDASKSISLWVAWTVMAFAAFMMFGIGSAGLIFIIVATSFASLNLSFRYVIMLIGIKACIMIGMIAYFNSTGEFPTPPQGIHFFEMINIWIVHSFIVFASATIIVYITATSIKLKREAAERAESSFFYGVGLLSLSHDIETGRHLSRVAQYSSLLTQYYFQKHPLEKMEFGLRDIELATNLHDIGKILTPPQILKKPGKLTPEEFNKIQLHTVEGAKLIKELAKKSEGISKMRLQIAQDIALNHHENWDGTGYPAGKRGKEIPASARIVSICDVYDALRSERPYKLANLHEESLKIMTNMSYKFDPDIFEIFMTNAADFDRIFIETG